MSGTTPEDRDDPFATRPAQSPSPPPAPSYGKYGDPPPPQEYGAPSGAPARNGLGIAALVLGLAGLLFAVLFFPLGFVLAVVGIILGIIGMRRASRGEATNRGMALSGVILSIVALLISIALGAFVGYIFSETRDCADPSLSETERQQCVEDKLEN